MTIQGKLKTFKSELIERVSWMSRLGQTHSDNRELYTVFGYKHQLATVDLYSKYVRQDIAKTIVEVFPDALWTRPPIVTGGGNGEFDTAWNQVLNKFPVWEVLHRADNMNGFGRFSAIIIGLNDGKKLDQPAIPAEGLEITYLQPYSELAMSVETWDENTASPRFGLPLTYSLSINESTVDTKGRSTIQPRVTTPVHYTRVAHIADNLLEDVVFGRPRLFAVYNLLDDLLKVAGGTAEVFWLTANRGMQLDIDKDMDLSPQDAEDLADEVDEYYHNLRRIMRTRGVKITELGAKVASPKDTFEVIVSLISASTRIPRRILLGAEAGQLASDQDRANWADRVSERRTKVGEPHVLSPFIGRLVTLGILPVPEMLSYAWPDAFILGPLERAQTSAQKARSAINLQKVFVDSKGADVEAILTRDEARNIVGFGDVTEILDDAPKKVQSLAHRRS